MFIRINRVKNIKSFFIILKNPFILPLQSQNLANININLCSKSMSRSKHLQRAGQSGFNKTRSRLQVFLSQIDLRNKLMQFNMKRVKRVIMKLKSFQSSFKAINSFNLKIFLKKSFNQDAPVPDAADRERVHLQQRLFSLFNRSVKFISFCQNLSQFSKCLRVPVLIFSVQRRTDPQLQFTSLQGKCEFLFFHTFKHSPSQRPAFHLRHFIKLAFGLHNLNHIPSKRVFFTQVQISLEVNFKIAMKTNSEQQSIQINRTFPQVLATDSELRSRSGQNRLFPEVLTLAFSCKNQV